MSRAVRVPVSGLCPGEITLSVEASHYLLHVQRLSSGSRFIAFDPEAGLQAEAELIASTGRRAVCRVSVPEPGRALCPLRVTLLQGMGKGDKPDRVIRDVTALGASRIVLVETERSVVRLARLPQQVRAREARWRKIAVEAARQSGRADTPEIVGPIELGAALSEYAAGHEHAWCCDPLAAESFAHVLRSWKPENSAVLLIGPEGGLSFEEIQAAAHAGFRNVRLGPLTLRTETAALAALSVLFVQCA